MQLRTIVLRLLAIAMAYPSGVFGASPAEDSLREILKRPLLLSFDEESVSDRFQCQVQCRVIKRDGTVTEGRVIAERSGDRAAVLVLSPGGYPCVLLSGHTLMFVDRIGIKAFEDGQFHCYAGATKEGDQGIDIKLTKNSSATSRITLDLNRAVKPCLVVDAEYGWDERFSRYWLTTPRGGKLSIYVHPESAQAPFRVRAIVTSANRRNDDGRCEMSISNIYVGETPPYSILDAEVLTLGTKGAEYVAASFAEIDAFKLHGLGASFNEGDVVARVTAARLAGRLRAQNALAMPDEDISRLRAAIVTTNKVTDARVPEALQDLRGLGSKHVWQPLQMGPRGTFETGFERFTLNYDRFLAAARTENVFGPQNVSNVYAGLAAVAANSELAVRDRCEALDLIGQFGLPALSPRLTELDAKFAKEPLEELRTLWSSVRVRQSIANDEDLMRLHKTVSDNRQHYDFVTAAIEALALAGELHQHAGQLPKLVRSADGSPATLSRRTRALAATPAGQVALLELLEQGSEDLVRRDCLAAVGLTVGPKDENWPRALRYAKQVALNPALPVADRAAANRIVYSDVETLKSGYAEEFFRMAQASDDMEALSGAMANMVAAGKASTCLEVIAGRLLATEAKKREEAAILCVAVATLEWKRTARLPGEVWRNVDTLFKDSEPSVRRYGPICILSLLDHHTPIPKSYVTPIAEAGLDFQDPLDLALACAALNRITDSDYAVPVDRDVTNSEVSAWMRQNADQVRQHLRTWHAAWQKRTGNH